MALYRNIAGAEQLGLLLQAVEPQDISPYGGGGYDTVFYDPGTWAIRQDTLTIDPATLQPVPVNTITPSQPLPAGDETVQTQTVQTTAVVPTPDTPTPLPAAQPEIDWYPLITIAGLFFTIFHGERILKDSNKLAFIGGLGALYYEFARKEK